MMPFRGTAVTVADGEKQMTQISRSEPPLKLPFIISTSSRKTDPETRKLIRSHVMRGKNRVKPSRKPKQLVQTGAPTKATNLLPNPAHYLEISKFLTSKFAGIGFAADVEPSLIDDILLFASISNKAMFLLNHCIMPTAYDLPQMWFEPMLNDAAYLHTACFTIQAFFDHMLTRTRNSEALQRDRIYYAKAVRLLQERLEMQDANIRLSDSTITTVLTLSGHAYTTGDFQATEYHIDGLLKLVNMRGVETFLHNTRFLIEIIRSDLGMAIDRGTKPVLFTKDDILWPLLLEKSTSPESEKNDGLESTLSSIGDVSVSPSHDLANIWTATSNFCTMANEAAVEIGPKMLEETFLHYMGSITYRLLYMQFPAGSLDEAVRLGLLAFLSPVFLNWDRVELPDQRFNEVYRQNLVFLTLKGAKVEPQERLWLFMIGALSMSHEPNDLAWLKPWLQIDMKSCDITSWECLKSLLSSFLWIESIYDFSGREIFNSMLS